MIIDKSKEFGVLQSMGLSKYSMLYIILIEGFFISAVGSITASILSYFILFFEKKIHFVSLPPDIYFMNHLPIKISTQYFIQFPMIVIIISILCCIFPAIKLYKTPIITTLHYE